MSTSIFNWHLNKGDEVAIASHLTCFATGDTHGIVNSVSGDSVFVRMTKSSLLRKFSVKHVRKVLPPLEGPLFRSCIGHCGNWCDNHAPDVHDWEEFTDSMRSMPHITNGDLMQICQNEGCSSCNC